MNHKDLIKKTILSSLQTLKERNPALITEKLERKIADVIPYISNKNDIKRSYTGALFSNKTFNWDAGSTSVNVETKNAIRTLRNRARDLFRNNPWVRKYYMLMLKNVVGDSGIKFQSRVKNGVGIDKSITAMIEDSFSEWMEKGNCTVCGRYNFRQVLNMVVGAEAIDGESPLVILVNGYPNKWGFALQILESDRIDLNLETRHIESKNDIIMGVELNKWQRAVAYWVLNEHPGDWYASYSGKKRWKRIPANDVIHYFEMIRPEQVRGVPPLHAVIIKLRMLEEYDKAQLIAAQIAACQMGFITQQADIGYQGGGYVNPDANDADNPPIKEIEPGIIEILGAGQDFKEFKPNSPSATHDSFVRSMEKGIASGLDTSYASLSNNYADANYASLRISRMDVLDSYKIHQQNLIDNFCKPVFKAFMKMALMNDLSRLNFSNYNKYLKHEWIPKGLNPEINPIHELKAVEMAINLGLTNTHRAATEYNGSNFDDNIEKLMKELKQLREARNEDEFKAKPVNYDEGRKGESINEK